MMMMMIYIIKIGITLMIILLWLIIKLIFAEFVECAIKYKRIEVNVMKRITIKMLLLSDLKKCKYRMKY